MRIDTHQHYWRYRPADYPWIGDTMSVLRRDLLPEDVLPAMARTDFDAAVAVQARDSDEETRWLLHLADRHPFVAGVVGWVDLRADDAAARIEAAASHPKLVGLRHIVHDEPDDRFLLDAAFCRGISSLAGSGLVFDILVFPRHLPVVIEFLERFPGQRFVLDHLAKPDIRSGRVEEWARDLEKVAQHPHLVAKLSGLVTEAVWQDWTFEQIRPYLDVAFEVFGAERLMIGSDWPVCTVAATYERTMGVTTDYLAGRTQAERDAVLGDTARRTWKLIEVP